MMFDGFERRQFRNDSDDLRLFCVSGVLCMHRSPSISPPPPDDQDVYLVFDDLGKPLGRTWRETPEGRTDRDAVVADLLDGQFNEPVRIVAFNTKAGWSRDVSRELAELILQGRNDDGFDVPPFLQTFIERHARVRQSQLSKRGALSSGGRFS
jgi:hypothetical protein